MIKYLIFFALTLAFLCCFGNKTEIPDKYKVLMQSISADLKNINFKKSILIKNNSIESERVLPDTLENKILKLFSFNIKGIEKRNENIVFVTDGWKGTYIGFFYNKFPPDFAINYQTIKENECYKVTFK